LGLLNWALEDRDRLSSICVVSSVDKVNLAEQEDQRTLPTIPEEATHNERLNRQNERLDGSGKMEPGWNPPAPVVRTALWTGFRRPERLARRRAQFEKSRMPASRRAAIIILLAAPCR
jgi:hypothetical protein